MDLLLGGTAAAMAGAICNPLEVIKVRMHLQGELKARGKYYVHYRNVFHAFYTVASKEGIMALEKGVLPFVCYQFAANSARLGIYQMAVARNLTRDSDGSINSLKTLMWSVLAGAIGGMFCSPFFLVKTHLQAKSNEISIAVGHQHSHTGMISAFRTIYREHGIAGLWRGTSAMIPRIAVANASQLLTFEKTHEMMKNQFPGQRWLPLVSACFTAGFFMSVTMAPFDFIATRFYNQQTTGQGKGSLYTSPFDCALKVLQKEGPLAFFKGWTACYFRFGPYTLLLLVFWDKLKEYQKQWENN